MPDNNDEHPLDLEHLVDLSNAIADYIERFALAIEQGPAVKEYATPVNRLRHDEAFVHEFKLLVGIMAGNIRQGMIQPEADWPELEKQP